MTFSFQITDRNAMKPQDMLYSQKVVQQNDWKNTNSLSLTTATAISRSTYTHNSWLSAVHS